MFVIYKGEIDINQTFKNPFIDTSLHNPFIISKSVSKIILCTFLKQLLAKAT